MAMRTAACTAVGQGMQQGRTAWPRQYRTCSSLHLKLLLLLLLLLRTGPSRDNALVWGAQVAEVLQEALGSICVRHAAEAPSIGSRLRGAAPKVQGLGLSQLGLWALCGQGCCCDALLAGRPL